MPSFRPEASSQTSSYNESSVPLTPDADARRDSLVLERYTYPLTLEPSLSAVLPVTSDTIPRLDVHLSTIILSLPALTNVILTCQKALLPSTRGALHAALDKSRRSRHPFPVEVTVLPWLDGMDEDSGVLYAATHATTSSALLLDSSGLLLLPNALIQRFARSRLLERPWGPRGFVAAFGTLRCITGGDNPQVATFLIPPVVTPVAAILEFPFKNTSPGATWSAFGTSVMESSGDSVGGIVIGPNLHWLDEDSSWCTKYRQPHRSIVPALRPPFLEDHLELVARPLSYAGDTPIAGRDHIRIVLPTISDLRSFSAAICRLQTRGEQLLIYIYGANYRVDANSLGLYRETLTIGRCKLSYTASASSSSWTTLSILRDWLRLGERNNDVLISLKDADPVSVMLASLLKDLPGSISTTVIQLPAADLPFTDWMGACSFDELRNWNKPQITMSITTHNRPHSFARLLASLERARFFGDSADLRINLEQTADDETVRIAGAFDWTYGRTFVHHRVVMGGLLPAVVESWYPRSNHSYGVLLEDDVELSPLFFAWLKMTLLRYRYGRNKFESQGLFGISLYHQRSNELRPKGRRPFFASDLFASIGLPPNLPYFSQVPCSWGALYFPEQWREFHSYLPLRLSLTSRLAVPNLTQDFVPHARSNRWKNSWKRYFIELAYLRGYTMLYPNYADNLSFSTNHLEPGSHVQDQPRDVYRQKQELFVVPLMPLPPIAEEGGTVTGLLEIPGGAIPTRDELPSLDFFGMLASKETLEKRGSARRMELFDCVSAHPRAFDARSLMCIEDGEVT